MLAPLINVNEVASVDSFVEAVHSCANVKVGALVVESENSGFVFAKLPTSFIETCVPMLVLQLFRMKSPAFNFPSYRRIMLRL